MVLREPFSSFFFFREDFCVYTTDQDSNYLIRLLGRTNPSRIVQGGCEGSLFPSNFCYTRFVCLLSFFPSVWNFEIIRYSLEWILNIKIWHRCKFDPKLFFYLKLWVSQKFDRISTY